MNNKKKRMIFLVALILLMIGIIAVIFIFGKDESYSNEYHVNERDDVVVYGGKEYEYNEHLSNYLFMGIDTTEPVDEYETREDAGRADAIYLLCYNRVEKTVKCLAIPRDTMTNIRILSTDGTDLGLTEDHINMQYLFGDGKSESCQLMKEAVSTLLYGIPIQGYCSMNMDGIPKAVSVLGGVELTVPDNTLETVNPKFKEGAVVTITEDDAEQFVRYRDTEQSQSAIARMNRQKVFMEAFIDTAKEKGASDTGLVLDMFGSLKPYMVTNMGTDLFAELLEATYDEENKIQDIPGEKVDGTDYDEYHVSETQLYELILEIFYVEVQAD